MISTAMSSWEERLLELPSYADRVARDTIPQKAKWAWFRGQSNDYPLRPKLFRGKYDSETDMTLDFRRRSVSFPAAPPSDDYASWLFFGQHHGLPTRLLDWTESALVGLLFALLRPNPEHPVVWVLNPSGFNWLTNRASIIPGTASDESETSAGTQTQTALPYIRAPYSGFPAERIDAGPDGTATRTDLSQSWTSPLAIRGNLVHERMLAQQSRFIIFGRNEDPLDTQPEFKRLAELGLVLKIPIRASARPRIIDELVRAGMNQSVMFPDYEGVAAELARIHFVG